MKVQERETQKVPEVNLPEPKATYTNGYVEEKLPNGEAVAAFIASGIGVTALGFFTTLADISTGVADWLKFGNNAVGPLFGKTLMTVLVWLVAWAGLLFTMRGKQYNFGTAFTITLALIALGFLGTFPTVFGWIADLFK